MIVLRFKSSWYDVVIVCGVLLSLIPHYIQNNEVLQKIYINPEQNAHSAVFWFSINPIFLVYFIRFTLIQNKALIQQGFGFP